MQGCPQPAAAHRGSKPGDPLGDMVFGLLFAKVLRGIRAQLLASGRGVVVPYAPNLPPWVPVQPGEALQHLRITDLSYHDDLMLPGAASSPEGALEGAEAQVRTVVLVFAKYGIEANFKRGKTELII
eukprot:4049968-Lingulodinium_polyedra.AAC.1